MAVPNGDDATSFMRAWGPFGQMAKRDRRLVLVPNPVLPNGVQDFSWPWVSQCDAIFVQRPWMKAHGQLLVLASMLGIPTWVDWDDDLGSVRRSNPKYHLYAEPDLRERLNWMAQTATVATVTTAALAERRGPKTRVLPNAQMWPPSQQPRARRVVWRGGGNHGEDVLSVLDQIEAVARLPQFAQWEWHFLGEPPWQVVEQLEFLGKDRLSVGFWADPFTYMRTMHALAPCVVIVPMADNGFNRCRSNLPILEATSAGAVALAKDLPEYVKAGAVTYHNPVTFGEELKAIMGGFGSETWQPKYADILRDARAKQKHYELEQCNNQRWIILEELGFPAALDLGRMALAPANREAAGS